MATESQSNGIVRDAGDIDKAVAVTMKIVDRVET